MKFDYVIGNPCYQKESVGANSNDTPLYHYFLDSSFEISDKVELIHPARFLFNAGGTPAEWNKKMLNDPHFKVEKFTQKSAEIFPGTDIKGGVAITYRDKDKNFGAIGTFTAHDGLNKIIKRVYKEPFSSLSDTITNRGIYKYSNQAYEEEPNELKKTADKRIAPSAFERMPKLFTTEKPNDNHEYIQLLGNIKNQRVYRWFRKDYIQQVDNINKYKVLVPKANGSGTLGETLSTPLIAPPLTGFTETYISIGECEKKEEAEACLKYIKTKFARIMLGVLKVTQNNAKPAWFFVPYQDFSSNSDIDWSKSIHEIDLQLYSKYGLSQEEIDFIETNAKEMN